LAVARHSNEDSKPKNRSIGANFSLNTKNTVNRRSQSPRLFPLNNPANSQTIENGDRAKIWNNNQNRFQSPPIATSVPPSPPQTKKKVRSRRPAPTPVKSAANIATKETRRARQTVKARKKLFPSIDKIVPASLSCLRFLVIACGVWAIAGTTVFLATNYSLQQASKEKQAQQNKIADSTLKNKGITSKQSVSSNSNSNATIPLLNLTAGQESTTLKSKLATIDQKYTTISAHAFFYELDGKSFVNLQGDIPVSAASTIKVPILMAFFQDVDSGKIKLDEMLTMTKELLGSGSGDMQYQKVGTKFSALETATKMIVISDNTATNMLIARLGGKDALNQRFASWGLEHTVIHNLLPDLEGTNTISPKDLVKVLALVERGELVSARSRDRILEIMRETKTRTLLPQGIEKNASIAHKTGDIGTILGDAGIIDMPNGKRYIASVMAKRPHNAIQGRLLIQEFSKTAYQHFKYTKTTPQQAFTE
jgi:beta-lactamase class A